MKQSVLLLYIFCLIGACSSNQQEIIREKEVPLPPANRVVLLFDGCIEQAWYTWPDGVRSGFAPPFEIRYLDDHHIPRLFIPDYAPAKDTLVINTSRATVEVQHAFRGVEQLSYLFRNGDSVLFTYRDSLPYATILNRQVNPEEVNYSLLKREQLLNGRPIGLVRMEPRFAFRDTAFAHIEDLYEKVDTAVAVGREAAAREYYAELKWLKSLEQQEAISAQTQQFYQQQAIYSASALYIPPYDYRNKKAGRYPARFIASEGAAPIPTMEELLHNSPDSLGANFFYQKLLDNYLTTHFWPKADWITTPTAKHRDYRQVYDSVRTSKAVNNSAKKQLLFKTMDALAENSSVSDLQTYWQKFQQDVPDTAYTNYIRRKYQLQDAMSQDLRLESLDAQKLTLAQLLEQHTGKAIYVDFWASWCGPCVRAFPASQQLQQAYEGKDVVFVYLSLDEDKAKWRAAAQEHQLLENSYLIENRHTSTVMDELQLSSIPRYLLYNKQGKLVQQNAPGPHTLAIKNTLNRILQE